MKRSILSLRSCATLFTHVTLFSFYPPLSFLSPFSITTVSFLICGFSQFLLPVSICFVFERSELKCITKPAADYWEGTLILRELADCPFSKQEVYLNGLSNLPANFAIAALNVWGPGIYTAMKNHFLFSYDNLPWFSKTFATEKFDHSSEEAGCVSCVDIF